MRTLFSLSLLILFLGSCQNADTPIEEVAPAVVNLYSHRHYDIDKVIFDQFEKETGIKVNVVKAGADELMVRLEQEGDQSPADLLVTSDAGRLVRAADAGFLQSIESDYIDSVVPAHLRDELKSWTGLTMRARVIVYSNERLDAQTAPASYEALAAPEWKGRVLARSSSSMYNQSLLASMIAHSGDSIALEWARGVRANMARDPKGNDRDQVKAIAAGEGDVAIVNTYYLGLLLNAENAEEVAAGKSVSVMFPNQSDRGTHVNISGAGLLKHSPNKENAIRLLEYLLSEKVQAQYAEANYEYPVHPRVKPSALLQSWGEFKMDSLNLTALGRNNARAVELFNLADWE